MEFEAYLARECQTLDVPNARPACSVVPAPDLNAGKRLSLVIPAYNEQDTIHQAIQEAQTALESLVSAYEILIVDDGCTDRTAAIVREQSAINPCVRLLQQPRNMGYGAALRAGFQAARFELVAFTDADCQFELGDLGYMLPLTDRFEIVSGYRIDRKDPVMRRFFSWGYNTLVQLLMGSRIRDIDCALKIYHKDSLPGILPEANNFFANTEMLSKARGQDLSVVDVGVHHRPRAAGESKVSLRDIPQTLKSLLPFWWTRVLFSGEKSAPAQSNRHFWAALVFLMVVAGALLFPNLSYPLIEPDEGRYAEIPREMLSSGDWIVPTLQFQPYLDKPPLFYWLCAGSYKLFGPTDWAARLVPAISAFLTVLMTFLFGSRILGVRSGFLGALTMCLSLGFIYCGRYLILDSLFSFLAAGSLFLAYEAVAGGKFKWSWWVASAMVCGLGFLTKGPVALLLLAPPVVASCWLSRLKTVPKFTAWMVYGLVAVAVAAPWYVAVSLRQPGFIHHFFWVHNFGRFMYSVSHPEPFWYFAPVLVLAWMPWGLLFAPLAVFLVKRSKEIRAARPLGMGYFVLWAGWCLAFFSLSKGKLPTYILPAWPAIALVLGHYLGSMGALAPRVLPQWTLLHSRFQIGLLGMSVAGVIGCAGAYFLQLIGSVEFGYKFVLWTASLVAVVILYKRWSPQVLYGVFSLIAFAVTFETAQTLFPAWSEIHAVLPVQTALHDEIMHSPADVINCGKEWGSVPFYLQRNDVTFLHRGNLEKLVQRMQERRGTYLVMNYDVEIAELQRLFPANGVVNVLWKTKRATIVYLRRKELRCRRRPLSPPPATACLNPPPKPPNSTEPQNTSNGHEIGRDSEQSAVAATRCPCLFRQRQSRD